jgi:TRAP-type C4-dicarboxylate transport system permease small subunit
MPGKSTRPSNADGVPTVPPRLIGGVDLVVRQVALWGGGTMLMGLMGLTVVDVTLRYFFNAPFYGARDVAKLMLLVMVALSVAYSARTGGQVVIEFFSRRMGPRMAALTEAAARLATLAMLAVLSRQLWISGGHAAAFGETSMALEIPYGPFYRFLAFGMLLYAAVLVVELFLILGGRMQNIGQLSADDPS